MKKETIYAIKQAINIIEENTLISNYHPLYMFSTENISGMLQGLDIKDKSILTVSASGDHIFNFLFFNAKEIHAFDINYLTKYYFYFKEAAIRTLNYREFLDFFFKRSFSFKANCPFNDIQFEKILANIKDEEAKLFWQYLYKKYGGIKLYHSNLFFKSSFSKNTYKECNKYLQNEASYRIVQERLKTFDYKFYWVDIFKDTSRIPHQKYDIIYLSNILDRLSGKKEIEIAEKIKNIIINLEKYLTKDGLLGLCYLYFYSDDSLDDSYSCNIADMSFRYKYFSDCIYKAFNGINDIKGRMARNRDALMLIRKKGED